MTSKITFLQDGVADYVAAHTSQSDELAQRLIAETQQLKWAGMQIGVPQGQFMAQLARALQPNLVIEIGTFTGYSALMVARELGPSAKLIACDMSQEWTSVGKRYWTEAGVGDKIDLRLGPAADTLAALDDDIVVDMAFIDADKAGYLGYVNELIPRLSTTGVILVDNVLWNGNVIGTDDQSIDTVALREFNAAMVADPRIDVALLPIGDGLSMISLKRNQASL